MSAVDVDMLQTFRCGGRWFTGNIVANTWPSACEPTSRWCVFESKQGNVMGIKRMAGRGGRRDKDGMSQHPPC